MSDYKDYVYDESFNDTIQSFDQYVQESALIIGGIIVGVVAFIGLMILLIKKVFFSKDTLSGSEWSITKSLISIKSLLDGPNVPQKITVQKGIPIEQFETDPGRMTGNLVNDVQVGARIIQSTKSLIKDLDATIRYIENNRDGGKAFNPDEVLKTFGDNKFTNDLDKVFSNMWVDNYTYDTGELRGRISYALKEDKELSNMLTNIDKRYKKLQKDSKTDANVNKALTQYYKSFVYMFNATGKTYSELYKQLRAALKNGSD